MSWRKSAIAPIRVIGARRELRMQDVKHTRVALS